MGGEHGADSQLPAGRREPHPAPTLVTVSDIMCAQPRSVSPHASLATAANIMEALGLAFLVVVDPRTDRVTGTVTDRDICLAVSRSPRRTANIPVHHVMTARPICVRPGDDARVAAALMRQHRVRRLPVVDRAHRLLGVVALADLARPDLAGRTGESHALETLRALATPRNGAEPLADDFGGSCLPWSLALAPPPVRRSPEEFQRKPAGKARSRAQRNGHARVDQVGKEAG